MTLARLTLLLLVTVEVANASGVLGPLYGISAHLVALGFASVSLLTGILTRRIQVHMSPAFLLFGVYIATQVPSVVVARDPAIAFGSLTEMAKDLWFLIVVVLLATAVSSAWTIARTIAGTMTVLAGLNLANQFLLGNSVGFGGFGVVSTASGVGAATARHAGPAEDPNFWGRLLILAIPLAVALAADAWQRRAKNAALLWGGCVLVLCGGLYLTQSRGSLLGLLVAAVVWMTIAGPKSRKALVLLPVAAILVAALPGVGSRIASLSEVRGASSGVGDYALVERTAAQQVALAIFTDNPAFGVGTDNIPAVWEAYKDQTDLPIVRVVAPHNLYLELAAEGGVLGLTGWLVFFVGIVALATRIIMASPVNVAVNVRGDVPRDRLLAAAVVAGLVGWAVASVFLHMSFLRHVLLVVAIVAVMDLQLPIADRVARIPKGIYAQKRPLPVRRLAVTAFVVLALATGLVGSYIGREKVWVARVPLAVLPQAHGATTPSAYEHDLLSRPRVLPTYAAVIERVGEPVAEDVLDQAGLDRAGLDVIVTGVSTRATVVVEVRGPRQELTSDMAERIARAGAEYVNGNPSLAALATVSVGTPTSSYETQPWLP